MFRRRRREEAGGRPDEVYGALRANALEAVAQDLGPPSPTHPDVAGLVVDVPAEGGFVTVVAMADDTTSMYTSVGGGVIGAGEHEHVAAATHRLLAVVQAHLGHFREDDDHGFPAPGRVRFHVLTPSGNRRQDVPEACFWGGAPHELDAVVAATQDVVAAMREASER